MIKVNNIDNIRCVHFAANKAGILPITKVFHLYLYALVIELDPNIPVTCHPT
jgi:hypothetical protein